MESDIFSDGVPIWYGAGRQNAIRGSSVKTRRSRNHKNPNLDQVDESLDKIVRHAKRMAQQDHNGTLVSKRERDQVASLYLMRSAYRIKDDLEGV